jgi:predicted ArsR family transcriptional regulator
VPKLPATDQQSFRESDKMSEKRRLSASDRKVVDLLMVHSPQEINELGKRLGVTATAVRQRLGRLMSMNYVERSTVSEGRGRPVHQYSLTEQGRLSCGNNLADLAVALWQQVQQIPDAAIRETVVSGAVDRLVDKYNSEIVGESASERMEAISRFFGERDLPVRFEQNDGLPVISVGGCLYPGLSDSGTKICELEQQVLERVVGDEVQLCTCQRQGDRCCSFQVSQVQTDAVGKVASGSMK